VRDSFADTESFKIIPRGVADLRQNRWPACVRMGGRIAPESVAGLAQITQISRILFHSMPASCPVNRPVGVERWLGAVKGNLLASFRDPS